MSIVVRFNPTNVTSEKYDESLKRLKEAGQWPPDGLDYHVLFGTEGNLRVSEIWDSQEQLEAFGERLMPILADIGIECVKIEGRKKKPEYVAVAVDAYRGFIDRTATGSRAAATAVTPLEAVCSRKRRALSSP